MQKQLIVNLDAPGRKISRHIYGHFAEHLGRCIYGGFTVPADSAVPNINRIRLDIVEALKRINIPNLRWPGGCFADEYHWWDGIGPLSERPAMVNTHWGGVTEDNSFGTHEFLELCALLECEPYITGNLGSGSVREMSQWIEYITFDGQSPMTALRRRNGRDAAWPLKYWGTGNENWGCGGNMTAAFYADQAKRYATYCRDYSGNTLYKIACGPSDDNYEWMETLLKALVACPSGGRADRYIQGISLHYYTILDNPPGQRPAVDADPANWNRLMERAWKIDTMLTRYGHMMDYYDPERKIGLVVDEWGTWHDVEAGSRPGFLYQQNTIRDALVASLHLDIFHKHADRITMANIAQTINVLQAMILTRGEQIILTPTYHVFEMNKRHQDAEALPVFDLTTTRNSATVPYPPFSSTISRTSEGEWLASMSNLTVDEKINVSMDLRGAKIHSVQGRILTSANLDDHNSFDKPETVAPDDFDGLKLNAGNLSVRLPPHSFVTLTLK